MRAQSIRKAFLHTSSQMSRRVAEATRLKPLAQPERHDLLEMIEDRHGTRSTLITSQLPVSSWHEYLNDPTVADALLDRLLSQSHRLELKGESMRPRAAA